MNWLAGVQIGLVTLLQLTAVVLMTVGVATPHWLSLFDEPSGQLHQHGLWQVCAQPAKQGIEGGEEMPIPFGESKCTFLDEALNENYQGGDAYLHRFNDWNMACLAIFSTAVLVGVVSLILGCFGATRKTCSIIWSVSAVVAAILAVTGIMIFAITANDANVKYIPLTTSLNTQHYGYSFWLAVAGCVVFGIVAILSILFTVIACRRSDPSERSGVKTWKSSREYRAVNQNTDV